MTASTDEGNVAFDAGWRAERAAEQGASLPSGDVTVSCSAPHGWGGLGRHLEEIVGALRRSGSEVRCVCGPGGVGGESSECRVVHPGPGAGAAGSLFRRSPAWRIWASSASFDAAAARELHGGDHLLAFSGQARAQFKRARERGVGSRSLVSPTSHLTGVDRRYREAVSRYPLEQSWTPRLLRRTLEEYRIADRIYVSSRYVWESFLEQGIAEERLALFPLTPAEAFRPMSEPNESGLFEILYVGSLSVVKGVPLLLDAFARQPGDELRLILLGGWESRGMRRHIEAACAADPRIEVRPGRPLEQLRTARLFVHPSYEDGFSYSCAEALACGVPVIASENTGAKELIEEGRTGLIAPTGDLDWLTEALAGAHRGELFNG
jgi:glycosyltransferase involved in cell wall biosynthesis